MRAWEVLDVGGLVTVQDAGRPGLAHLGVPRAGWLDAPAARHAHRLVGNDDRPATRALLEVTLGGLRLRSTASRWVAVTGAACTVSVDGAARAHGRPEWLPAGAELRLGPATTGVRSYLAVAGGLDVEPVLGSRSTDTLAWVGPPLVTAGTVLALGEPAGPPVPVDVPAVVRPGPLRVRPGPRADWFAADALDRLCATSYVAAPASDRVGLRLAADSALERVRPGELASEGMVLGAVQVPPDGRPVVLLADHPTTGGYPVLAVVERDDLARCAQVRPGGAVRFVRVP
ncbi:biotin-dependent carboxyltransferase family protein [Nocardioides sp. 1609]|uniref:5-oxoprolinase subunit C family protein n=1 Tax=Nocardioides sp. 1609 TaxID=2508327 RepID=UPI00106F9D1A|nr:biotin-dependent carboxyltransferase family protein [Nocardioides sp. 1609]